MLGQKKKFSRKEMKEDTLVTFYYKAIEYFEEYKKYVFIGVGAIAVIILAFFLYSESKSSNNEKANVELSRVIPLYEQGAYLEAIEGKPGTQLVGLKKIVEEYGNSDMGEVAKIYLANSYYNLGKFDEAMKFYDDFGGDNETFQATAFAGIAACYEAKNNIEDAVDYYRKAASVSKENVLNPQYLLSASINLITLNKKEEARELLKQIKKDFTNSPYTREIDRYLAITE